MLQNIVFLCNLWFKVHLYLNHQLRHVLQIPRVLNKTLLCRMLRRPLSLWPSLEWLLPLQTWQECKSQRFGHCFSKKTTTEKNHNHPSNKITARLPGPIFEIGGSSWKLVPVVMSCSASLCSLDRCALIHTGPVKPEPHHVLWAIFNPAWGCLCQAHTTTP